MDTEPPSSITIHQGRATVGQVHDDRRERHPPQRGTTAALWSGMFASTRNPPVRRVAVLGAGVMGSGIAAHCANAGIPVLLLDIVPPKISDADRQSKAKR